jgi:hypothetical protein
MKQGSRLGPVRNYDPEHPYGRGLFGRLFEKQKNLYVKKVDFPLIPLEDLTEGLIAINERQWGLYAIHRDPINGKFTEEDKDRYITKSMECADKYAGECRNSDGTYPRPSEIASKLGINVQKKDRPPATGYGGNSVMFAQFTSPADITIYQDCINKAKETMMKPAVRQLIGKVDIEQVLLAHEIFHYFEERDKKTIYTETERKTVLKLGPITNSSRIVALGEIAAMHFAKDIIGLSYSPYVFDILLTYGYSKKTACNLYGQITTFLGIYKEPERLDTETKYDT